MFVYIRENWKSVLSWVLQILISLQFWLAGLEKYIDPANWVRRFQNWSYPDNFFYIVGAAEILLAVMLLTPKMKRVGSIGTILFMVGAAITHLRAGDGHYWVAVVTGILASGIYVLNTKLSQYQ